MASANFIQQMPANLTEQQKERWIKSREEALKRKAEADQREQRQSQATLQNGCGNPMPSTSKHSNAATFIAQHQYKNQQQFSNVHRKDPPQKQPLPYVPNIPTVQKIQPEKPSMPPLCRSTNPTLQVSFDLSLFDEDGQRFKLIYNPYRDFINDKIKEVPSRVYEQADRSWTFALKDYELVKKKINELRIHKIDLKIEEIPLGVRKNLFLDKISPLHNLDGNSKLESDESILNTVDHRIRKILFPFQRRGVCFGIRRNGRLLIADEMGLGKTVQAIAIASSYRVEWPLLIVCPSSVKYMWQRQIFNFMPDTRPYVIERKVDELPMSRTTDLVIIMSYDLMSSRINELKRQNYYVVIFDECHLLKESKTMRTKTATELAKQSHHVLLLSGTPALSRPAELFTQIRMIDPKIFTNYKDYAVRYCDGQLGRFGFEAKGQSNAAELKAVMNKIMIRRLKKDVLEDLPAKRREIVYLTGDVIKNKMKELKNAKEELQRNDRFTNDKNMKTQSFMEYYVLTGQAKMEAIAKHIIDTFFYKDAPEKKILVFAHHLGVLDHIGLKIASEGIGFIRIDGGTNARDRQTYCEQFQTSPKKKVALLSITAAGTGITLTAASIVIFAELYWNPSLMIQAEDRAHRVGQQDSVQVQYMLAKNTADSVIWQMISSKLQILGNVNLANESYGDAKSSSKLCVDPNEQHLITDFYSLLNQMDEEKKQKENDQSMKGMDIVDFGMDGEDEPEFKRAKSSSDLDEWDESELTG